MTFRLPRLFKIAPRKKHSETVVSLPRPKKSDLADARALVGAIALGLIFALALTVAASWAPESFAKRGLQPNAHPYGTSTRDIDAG